jgi:hypothetical protein
LLIDPRVVRAAKLLGVTVMQAKETADGLNMPLLALLGLEEAPVGEMVEQYVLGGPLIKPEEEGGLSTHMRNLNYWYKEHIKKRTSNVLSSWTLERSITSKVTCYIFQLTNCLTYSISANSTSLPSVAIVCK